MLTISLVLVFGIAVVVAMRTRALPIGTGILAILFGFFLGPTGAAEPIHSGISALASTIADFRI